MEIINSQVHEHEHAHGRACASLREHVHCDVCDCGDDHGGACACGHGCGCSHGCADVHVGDRGCGCVRAHVHAFRRPLLCGAGGGWHAQRARVQGEALARGKGFSGGCAPCEARVQQQGRPRGGDHRILHDDSRLFHNPSHWPPVAGHSFLVGRFLLLVDQLLEPTLHMEGATPEIGSRGSGRTSPAHFLCRHIGPGRLADMAGTGLPGLRQRFGAHLLG